MMDTLLSREHLRKASLLLAIFWMGFIFFLSHQQSLPTPALFPGQDKMFHGIVFGILGGLYLGAMRPDGANFSLRQVGIATLLVCLYGMSDELHQSFVPGRTTEFLDVVADTTGGLVITLAVRFFGKPNK